MQQDMSGRHYSTSAPAEEGEHMDRTMMAKVEQDIAEVKAQVEKLATAPPPDEIRGLQDGIQKLNERFDALFAHISPEQVVELSAKVDALAAQVAELHAQPAEPPPPQPMEESANAYDKAGPE